ncbi:MAG TPA: hypothetical protein VIS48_14035 [Candidatus Kryptonia bacterium]
MNLRVLFDIPTLVLVGLALLSAGLAYVMYAKLEALSRTRQFLLTGLRSLTFFLVCLEAVNVVTSMARDYERKREAVILIDNSRSMSLKDGPTLRSQVVENLLRSKSLDSVRRNFNVRSVAFGGDIKRDPSIDSLRFDEPATNIGSAIDEAARVPGNNPAGFALLLSDGNYNAGESPVDAARDADFPIFTVGIGDSSQPKDVFVRQVIAAPNIYAGRETTVRAIVSSYGFGGQKATVRLTEDGREISSKSIVLPVSGDIEVPFDYTPVYVGTHVLALSAPFFKDEFNKENNSSSVTVDVRKGRYNVLVVAGEPSADLAFLKRTVEDNADFESQVLIQKNGGEFYEKNAGEILSSKYDAIMLCDFPNVQSSQTLIQISNLISSTGIPYFYLAGNQFSPTTVSKLPRLPLTVAGFQGGEFQIGLYASAEASAPLELQPLNSLFVSNYALLPPLYYQRVDGLPVSGTTALVLPVMNGTKLNSPILYFNLRNRSAAFLAYGLWRLKMMSALSGLQPDFLNEFIETILRTLINGGKQKLLTLHTDKKNYDPSEKIQFNALLVDQAGSPVSDAAVDVRIESEGTHRTFSDIQLAATGEGGYSGEIPAPGEGKYVFVGRVSALAPPATFYGADSGTVVVEPLRTEFVQTPMNATLLRQVASVSGGRFMTPEEFIRHGLNLNPEWKEPVDLTDTKKFEILSLLPALGLALALLTVEWTLRKLWGLP